MAHASLPSLGELLLLLLLHPFWAGYKALGSPQPFSFSAVLKPALLEQPAMGPFSRMVHGAELGAGWAVAVGGVLVRSAGAFLLDSTPMNRILLVPIAQPRLLVKPKHARRSMQ